MIKTSRQLKDKIRNLSKGDSGHAQFLIIDYETQIAELEAQIVALKERKEPMQMILMTLMK